MRCLTTILLLLCCSVVFAQGSTDWTRAPNSYIFTGKNKAGAEVDGLYIPVKKAFAMWADNSDAELSLNNPMPAGTLSAYVYWEDVSGLIMTDTTDYKLGIQAGANPEDGKIIVPVNKAKGKGNALVSLHCGPNGNNTDPVYWSWHVWVTDDVAVGGSTYRQGYETDKNNVPFASVTNRDGSPYVFQWMNRNLGATNAEFLGHDWNKSSGLMYQWGRKDPIPPLMYKDGTGYEINGAAGTFRSQNFTQNTTSPYGWTMRPFNNPANHSDVRQNIGYAVQNPMRLITFLPRYGHWFSDQSYKVSSSDIYSVVNWDLWSDNRKGLWSNFSTSNTAAAMDTKSYELKSPYDPCPCNWRIPSHYGSIVGGGNGNKFSPWGRKANGDDDANNNSAFRLDTINPVLDKVKVYPSLGFDFRQQQNTGDVTRDRNLGIFPITGAFVFVGPNEVADYYSPTPKTAYINWLSTGGAPTATLSVYDNASARFMGLVSDYYKFPTQGKYRMVVNQIAQSKGASTARCMLDPNEKLLGNFETEFFGHTPPVNNIPEYTFYPSWAKDPNSYIVMPQRSSELRIPVRKAYAMHYLYLSGNNEMLQGLPSVSVYWTSNSSLISNVTLAGTTASNSEIVVTCNTGQTGNAVVAFHMGTTGTAADPVIWSWHVWAPETVPIALPAYKTENAYQPNPAGQIVNPTNSLIPPPLETIFMDRNLGALVALPGTATVDPAIGKKAMGLHYQWGRKDPLPTFQDQLTITRGNTTVNAAQYLSNFTRALSVYGAGILSSNDKPYAKLARIQQYAAQNPLTYLYNDGSTPAKDWISDKTAMAADRWGHATEKSPFDPCPAGWRIPDVSYTFDRTYAAQISTGVKGTSPWYLGKVLDPKRTDGVMGVDQIWDSSTDPVILNAASQTYKGQLVSYTGGGTAGWSFSDPVYSVGNYPATGIRGESSAAVDANFPRTGVWTAALDDLMSGYGLGLSIRYSKMATGRGSAPHQAMSCRCAQIQYDASNKEIGRYDPNAIPVSQKSAEKATGQWDKKAIDRLLSEQQFSVFPNPVADVLRIAVQDDKDYYYQIYNMAGQLVQSGRFANREASVATLAPGAYLLRINNAENVIKIIKR